MGVIGDSFAANFIIEIINHERGIYEPKPNCQIDKSISDFSA